MPLVTLASDQQITDRDLKARIQTFLQKLQESDETAGLRIKPIRKSLDPRFRTGRVSDFWRAVLFELNVKGKPHYFYYGTFNHDEAIDLASRIEFKLNPTLGIAEIVVNEVAAEEPAPAYVPEPPRNDDAGEAWENILRLQWTVDELVEFGIPADVAQTALAAATEAEFLAVCERTSDTFGLILLDLNLGKSIEQVRDELGLTPIEGVDDEDEAISEALKKPSLDYVHVGEDPGALSDAIESMSIDRWRVFLHPEQRRYAEGSWNGAYRLSGGAGTGKTVVLLHRARHLHKQNPEARILLTTFTTTLAQSLETNLMRLDPDLPIVELGEPGIAVVGIDGLANRITARAGGKVRDEATHSVLGGAASFTRQRVDQEKNVWKEAVTVAGSGGLRSDLTNPEFLAAEYQSVVLPQRILKESDYLRVARRGRGTALNRSARKDVWKIIEQFRRGNELDGRLTFEEVAAVAAEILERSGGIVDHVILDEGQDFHPLHWQLLRALVDEGPNDLFIAEDSHQRIYGQHVTLSHYGINIRGRARRLTLNYRTTAQNLAYAMGILRGVKIRDIEDDEESTEYYASLRAGTKPIVVDALSEVEELEAVRGQIATWIDEEYEPEGIGILTRTNKRAQELAADLKVHGVAARYVSRDQNVPEGNVAVMTMHAAKGMEFSCVAVVGAGEDQIPAGFQLDNLPEAEKEDARLRERSLLYVAATRARDELMITRTAPSAFGG